MIDAIGADNGEADLTRFVDAVIGGQEALLERELARLAGEGQEGIPLVRALLRRLISLATARAEVERGASPSQAADRVGRALFWKEKNAIARDVGRWPAPRIARAIDRLSLLDRELRRSAGPGPSAPTPNSSPLRGLRRASGENSSEGRAPSPQCQIRSPLNRWQIISS